MTPCRRLAVPSEFIFTLLLGSIVHLVQKPFDRAKRHAGVPGSPRLYLSVFFLGFCMHLLGDIPTPGSTWKGIKLFWPLGVSVGGTGHIWWWNNYDIFLLLLAGCGVNFMIIALNSRPKKPILNFLPTLVYLIAFGISIFQITHRPFRFAGPGSGSAHAEKERRSLSIQKEILGKPLFSGMTAFDRRLKIPF